LFSYVSDTLSNLNSRVTKEVAYKSQVSDLHSDLRSYLGGISSLESDIYSLLGVVNTTTLGMSDILSDTFALVSSLESDFQSRFPATIPELTSDPGATPTWARAQALQYAWLKHNSKSTSTKRYLRNAAGTTILSAVMSEDGASFLQGTLG